jgi:hypothetical protein
MPYVIEAAKNGHDDRYIGQSDVTQHMYWTRSLRMACKFEDLDLLRRMLDNIMDDEHNRDISVLVAAFGLMNKPGPHSMMLMIREVLPDGSLGDFCDQHGIRYQIKKEPRVVPIPIPA